jgi:hypothetical protein
MIKTIFLMFFVFCLTAFLLSSCDLGVGDEFIDDNKLNPRLIGTWSRDFGGGEIDTYIITADSKITHPSSFGNALTDAGIEYVYNFSDAAGCLIIERNTDNKFTAVYYKDLKTSSIIIGDAINPDLKTYPTAKDLEEAKTMFAPENRTKYRGDLSKVAPISRTD